MELYDLYTAGREKTGKTMERGEPTPPGYYRLIIHVCIFSEDGKMLIQQRQPSKKIWPDKWDISVSGCAISGDNSKSAAERETREELGLSIDLSDMRPAMTVYWGSVFEDIYVLTKSMDLASLQLQKEEVQAVRWASKGEILRMIEDGRFIPLDKSLIEYLFFRRNHQGSLREFKVTENSPGLQNG